MIFYNIFISPIELIIDWVFNFFIRKLPFLGILGAIVGVSLAINFLALPIYNIADSLQDKERKIQQKLKPGIQRIKAVFFGDERFMILQTFYRENHYHPIYAFKSSLSILIEIPFFIAAYHYLSNSELLKVTPPPLLIKSIVSSFSEPDRIFSFQLFGRTFFINILPILMTVINIFSGISYSKQSSFREKIQIYGLALVFLFLLYNSPSGLVIYWIFNNLFSFAKNIVKSCKNPEKILHILISVFSLSLSLLFWILRPDAKFSKKILLTLAALFVCALPFFLKFSEKLKNRFIKETDTKEYFPLFLLSCLGLDVLLGLTLPLNVISSDAAEFSFIGNTESPFSYVKTSALLFTGLCVVWPILLYKMFDKNAKVFMTKAMFTLFVSAVLNAFVFKFNYGNLNVNFAVSSDVLQKSYPILNILSVSFFFAIIILLTSKFGKIKNESAYATFILLIALTAISTKNAIKTKKVFDYYKQNIANKNNDNLNSDIEPIFHLSKTEQNVVVFFLDRATSAFFPIFQEEMPELAEKFNGFTYFPNTISFGNSTLYGSTAMLGGYDYTPENINSRGNIPLQKKYNESALIMPLNFLANDFSITVSGLPSTDFRDKNDFRGFESFPEIKTYGIFKKYIKSYEREKSQRIKFDDICRKGITNFSILQALLPAARNSFSGITKDNTLEDSEAFLNNFSSLYFLRNLTDFHQEKKSFIFIGNDSPHYATWLNTESYDEVLIGKNQNKYIPNSLKTADDETIMNYQVFVAVLKQIGLWLDLLRENNCFNNTRIVITSDHGYKNKMSPGSDKESKFYNNEILAHTPLLMVKDFDSASKIKIDKTFMTNADTIFLASRGIINNLKNPFLGQPLKQEKSDGILVTNAHSNKSYNKYKLLEKPSFKVKNNVELSNWEEISR